jgi:DNA-binding beta-propeller fold protein YncE
VRWVVMKMHFLLRTALVSLVASLALVGVARAQEKVFILDSEAPAVTALDLTTAKAVARLALSGKPVRLRRSPDGSRLVAFDRGPGEDKRERGYKATGKSAATVVDLASMSVVGRVELGFGVEADRSYFSPDGRRLTVFCPGYDAKNPAESQMAELVNVDLVTGRETGRLALEPGTVPIVASKDGRTLPLIQGLPRGGRFPFPQSRLWIVDLAGPSVVAKLDTGTWMNLYTDGAHFYLLDPGKPDKSPQKNKNGAVQVASLERRALAGSLDVGRAPRGLYQDELGGQVFIPGDGPPGAPGGQLRVIRGDQVAATIDVAFRPKLLKRDRDVVYVVGEKAVTLVDPGALKATATIPLAKGNDGLVEDDDLPTELAVSPDGKRAFIHYGIHNKVVVLDLEANRAVGATKTGRGGKKLFGNLMGGMFGIAGFLAAGYSPWAYTAPAMLAVRPDGRFAYAINVQTKDVTVVDGITAETAEMIGGGGYALKILGGGAMAVVSGDKIQIVDTVRNTKTAELELPELRRLAVSPDGAHAVAMARRLVVLIDGRGEETARLTDLLGPSDLVFESVGSDGASKPR